jgi:hypothetical protein
LAYISILIYLTNTLLGITGTGKTFSIGFCFLPGELSKDYTWAFNRFKEHGINPSVVVIDGDDACKNGSIEVWPNAPAILCTWHVEKNVFANYKKAVPSGEGWDEY